MDYLTGRHRRPRQSMAGRVWALTAAMLAIALAYVFVPDRPRKEQHAITRVPHRRELPTPPKKSPASSASSASSAPADFPRQEAWTHSAVRTSANWGSGYYGGEPRNEKYGPAPAPDPDEVAGALVRPYLTSASLPVRTPRIPQPRVPVGDLLSAPVETTLQARSGGPDAPDDLSDLAAVVRVYLDRIG